MAGPGPAPPQGLPLLGSADHPPPTPIPNRAAAFVRSRLGGNGPSSSPSPALRSTAPGPGPPACPPPLKGTAGPQPFPPRRPARPGAGPRSAPAVQGRPEPRGPAAGRLCRARRAPSSREGPRGFAAKRVLAGRSCSSLGNRGTEPPGHGGGAAAAAAASLRVRPGWERGSCPRELPGQGNPEELPLEPPLLLSTRETQRGHPLPTLSAVVVPPGQTCFRAACRCGGPHARVALLSPHSGCCLPCSGPVARSFCPTRPTDKWWDAHLCSWRGPACLQQAVPPAQL